MRKTRVNCPDCRSTQRKQRALCQTCRGTGKIEVTVEDLSSLSYVDDVYVSVEGVATLKMSVYIDQEGNLIGRQLPQTKKVDTVAWVANPTIVSPSHTTVQYPILHTAWRATKRFYDMCKDIHNDAKVELMP